jgi:hypothetical protein
MPPCPPKRARGFLFARMDSRCYDVQQSPWTGKLQAAETFRILPAWLHRSNEKVATAAVSCVGQLRRKCRAGADTLLWSSGMGSRPADRQRLTSANATSAADKTEQRRPSTRWAKHRKVQRQIMLRASCTKDARFGLTDGLDCSCQGTNGQAEAADRQAYRRPDPLLARHGSGALLISDTAFFQVICTCLLVLRLTHTA